MLDDSSDPTDLSQLAVPQVGSLQATGDPFQPYRLLDAAGAPIGVANAYFAELVAQAVRRLCAYRGVTELGALTVASEVCDWRRFPSAGTFAGFCGLVPSESSSGERTRRGGITHAGITHAGNTHLRTQLVESAWAYKSRAQVGPVLRRRHEGLDPEVVARAWAAQLRLCGRFKRLDARKTSRKTVVTAIARELACFCWAEMTAA